MQSDKRIGKQFIRTPRSAPLTAHTHLSLDIYTQSLDVRFKESGEYCF